MMLPSGPTKLQKRTGRKNRLVTIPVVAMILIFISFRSTSHNSVVGYSFPISTCWTNQLSKPPPSQRPQRRRQQFHFESKTSIGRPTILTSRIRDLTRSMLLAAADINDSTSISSSSNNKTRHTPPSTTSPLENVEENNDHTLATIKATATIATTTKNTATTETSKDETSVLPSYRRLIVFTATTILIWLSEPLLSLVDTSIVGLTAASNNNMNAHNHPTVVQIAALGPATTLYDSAIYMTYFLAIATTNQLAPNLARQDYHALRQSTSHLMGLAILFGTIVLLLTFTMGRSILYQMVGTSVTTTTTAASNIIPLATTYVKIRATVAPLAVMNFVAQSFCLAILDTKTPALAVAVASIVNIVGDWILSPRWGIQGAAVATALATSTSCVILLTKVRRVTAQWRQMQQQQQRPQQNIQQNIQHINGEHSNNIRSAEMTTTQPTTTTTTIDDDQSTSTNTSNNSHDIPFVSLPKQSAMVELLKLAGPIFFVMMSKIACYGILTVRATGLGVIPLATHNIMMRVFFFFACFGDSLSQAAQSFYPQLINNDNVTNNNNNNSNVRRKFLQRLFYLSLGIGITNYQLSRFILQHCGRFLTKDSAILHMMAKYSTFVAGAVFLHPFVMLLEGTVLARRDLVFMVGMYIATALLHLGNVSSPASASFLGLWRALFVFQSVRLVQFALRVWHVTRREKLNHHQQQQQKETVETTALIPAIATLSAGTDL
jgi:Na+-driven multidrug efflux pump